MAKKFRLWSALLMGLAGCSTVTPRPNATAEASKVTLENVFEQAPTTQEVDGGEIPVKFSLQFDILSQYVFRGLNFGKDPVLQLTQSVTSGKTTLMTFENFDTGTRRINETDVIVDYTTPFGKKTTFSTGYGHLHFFGIPSLSRTQEIYAAGTLNTLLKPSAMIVYDFDAGKGLYGELSLAHEGKLAGANLIGRATLGYNHRYFTDNNGVSHLEMSLSLPQIISEKATIIPSISVIQSLDKKDIEDSVTGGVGVSINF